MNPKEMISWAFLIVCIGLTASFCDRSAHMAKAGLCGVPFVSEQKCPQ